MVYAVKIAKHGEIIKSRVRYLCTSKKNTKSLTGGLQRHNEREPLFVQTKYQAYRTKDNIFLKPMTERMASGWMTRLGVWGA